MADEVSHERWVDEASSKELSVLCAQGEGQALEYIEKFPDQARDLAKEIAAFATSNAGTILIGVNDDGEVVGISDTSTAAERDRLFRRLEGLCRGTVVPAITPTAQFAQEGSRTVLVLRIPKGSEPLYYVGSVPYVRHLTESRPAGPHEVIARVRQWLGPVASAPEGAKAVEEVPDGRVQFFADLMRDLIRVKILGEEINERMIDPWLELVRAQYADVAAGLRERAAAQIAVDDKVAPSLLELAEALSRFAKMRLHLGSGPDISRAMNEVMAKAQAVLARVKPDVVAHVSESQLVEHLRVMRRQLAVLNTDAATVLTGGRLDDLQARASELGASILFTSHYGIERLAPDLYTALSECGRKLHLSETERVYLDGGVSLERIASGIQHAIEEYNRAVDPILGE